MGDAPAEHPSTLANISSPHTCLRQLAHETARLGARRCVAHVLRALVGVGGACGRRLQTRVLGIVGIVGGGRGREREWGARGRAPLPPIMHPRHRGGSSWAVVRAGMGRHSGPAQHCDVLAGWGSAASSTIARPPRVGSKSHPHARTGTPACLPAAGLPSHSRAHLHPPPLSETNPPTHPPSLQPTRVYR